MFKEIIPIAVLASLSITMFIYVLLNYLDSIGVCKSWLPFDTKINSNIGKTILTNNDEKKPFKVYYVSLRFSEPSSAIFPVPAANEEEAKTIVLDMTKDRKDVVIIDVKDAALVDTDAHDAAKEATTTETVQ